MSLKNFSTLSEEHRAIWSKALFEKTAEPSFSDMLFGKWNKAGTREVLNEIDRLTEGPQSKIVTIRSDLYERIFRRNATYSVTYHTAVTRREIAAEREGFLAYEVAQKMQK